MSKNNRIDLDLDYNNYSSDSPLPGRTTKHR